MVRSEAADEESGSGRRKKDDGDLMRSWGLISLIVVATVLLIPRPGHGQNASTSSFNHFLTGFPLTGTHVSVSCASCHVNGRLKNTPTLCIGCHNTMTAPGEPQSHPKTTNRCEGCHLTTTWRDIAFMDHAQATGPCASCHNNKLAVGKSPNHIVTNAPCGSCHHNTVSFAGAMAPSNPAAANTATVPATAPPAVVATPPARPANPTQPIPALPSAPPSTAAQPNMSHVGVIGGCARCHNGVTAGGKPPNHAVTNAPCESCHKSTVTFAGAGMNHAGIIANCASCHNGSTATGKPTKHIVANAPCESCHKSTVTFEGARLDHFAITATCASCHNGTTGEGKPARHFLTTSPCEGCHRTSAWIPASYRHASPAYVDHGGDLGCTSCHVANAQTVAWRSPAFRPGCAGCHFDKYRPTSHPKFQRPVKVYYTIAELRDCTGACHIFTDNTQRTILSRQSGLHRSARGGW
jgi:hypothetical protein